MIGVALNPTALDLLDTITQGRWRHAELRLARPARDVQGETPVDRNKALRRRRSDARTLGRSDVPQDAQDAFDAAWRLAEAFDRGVDRRRGFHATPRAVARELAALVVPADGPLVDPACGAGALLLAGLEARWRATGRVEVQAVAGADLDPIAVGTAEAVLWVAAGQPARLGAQLAVRDFLHEGLGVVGSDATVLANPPWGVKVGAEELAAWEARVGAELAALLVGEVNIYTLFLIEAVLARGLRAGFVTPIHWLHRRSLATLRQALARSGRLGEVVVLRKRVFSDAPDMIPALTAWRARPSEAPIDLRRTGFRAPIPLPEPLPTAAAASVSREGWCALPFTAFPLLYSTPFGALGRLLHGLPRLSDPDVPRAERWLHLGDGAYKSRVRPHVVAERGGGWPILTRAAQVGRYRVDAPSGWLSAAGEAALTAGERARFASPKLVMHALKKAAAAWRLAGGIHEAAEGPLALTNNFLVGVAQRFAGDLHYASALLNSRLYNRVYTEHFPGVNIEACTVGVLPFPWPPVTAASTAPPGTDADPLAWHAWAHTAAAAAPGAIPEVLYAWLVAQGRRLQHGGAVAVALDHCVEAVVAGLLGATERELVDLLEAPPHVEA